MKEFGQRLRKLRKERHLLQEQLGQVIAVGGESISGYELGSSLPPSDKLLKLAKFFGVSMNYLLEGDVHDVASAEIEDVELLNLFLQLHKSSSSDKRAAKHLLTALVKSNR